MTLDELKLPEDISKLDAKSLEILAHEVRERIIETVKLNGGHLGASLGAVELTLALVNIFSPDTDIILFDVGHQSYAYKMLTDRRERFSTLRRYGGISGFPNPDESRYDKFTAGHAGNALAAACGYLRAKRLNGGNEHIIAVLGDGVLVNGLTAESLNNVSQAGKAIIVINDNEFSISQSVGSIAKYLSCLKRYSLADGVIIEDSPFKIFDIDYIGVVDGHNIQDLLKAMDIAKKHPKSVIIHAKTVKGKGLPEAERNPVKYHAVGNGVKNTFAHTFGAKLTELAAKHKEVVAVTAAMGVGTGLTEFAYKFPDRFFDVGIAEGHAVTMSAAMARAGLKPYVAIYSTFLQRAYDQLINDVCLSGLPVTFCIDRSGIVGEDGATHHGIFDLSFLCELPGITVVSPASLLEAEELLEWSINFSKPLAIRYPREEAIISYPFKASLPYWVPYGELYSEKIILATGAKMVEKAVSAQKILKDKGINVDVVNARFNKPLDTVMLDSIKDREIYTLEDGLLKGGFGDSVRAYYQNKRIRSKGIDDRFVAHGDTRSLFAELQLDAESIAEWIISDEA